MTDVHYVLGIPVPKPTCPAVEKIFHDFAVEIATWYDDVVREDDNSVAILINKYTDKIREQATEPLRNALSIALERLYEAEQELEKYAKKASDLEEARDEAV